MKYVITHDDLVEIDECGRCLCLDPFSHWGSVEECVIFNSYDAAEKYLNTFLNGYAGLLDGVQRIIIITLDEALVEEIMRT